MDEDQVPEAVYGYGVGGALPVDDCLIWVHADGVTFHSQIIVDWDGFGFYLAVPGWPTRIFVDSSAEVSDGLANTWRGPLLPFVAALAREIDDSGPKRTWTPDEIRDIAEPSRGITLVANVGRGIRFP